MSTKPATAEQNGVVLVRIGVGRQEFSLPEGATLADLLRMAQTDVESGEVFIDGRSLQESLVLRPGTIVSVVPKTNSADPLGEWRGVIGAFHNNPEFDAMMREVNAEREAEKERP